MKTSTSKKELSQIASSGDLTKLGGDRWINRLPNQSITQPRTLAPHKKFAKDCQKLQQSSAIEDMLSTKRDKNKRQFMNT